MTDICLFSLFSQGNPFIASLFITSRTMSSTSSHHEQDLYPKLRKIYENDIIYMKKELNEWKNNLSPEDINKWREALKNFKFNK